MYIEIYMHIYIYVHLYIYILTHPKRDFHRALIYVLCHTEPLESQLLVMPAAAFNK